MGAWCFWGWNLRPHTIKARHTCLSLIPGLLKSDLSPGSLRQFINYLAQLGQEGGGVLLNSSDYIPFSSRHSSLLWGTQNSDLDSEASDRGC